LGSFWTEPAWPVCQTGLTGFPCLCEAKSNRSGLTGFRNWPDRFGLPAAMSCVFPLRVCCGCWLGLAPRSSSTSVAAWTWQEKLAEVNEWNRVHRPNSWIEFLSVPFTPPSLVCSFGPSRASNFRHPLFEWSVSLPRIFDMRNAHVWQNMVTSQPIKCSSWIEHVLHRMTSYGKNTYKTRERPDEKMGSVE
jgi:hypothetical protein